MPGHSLRAVEGPAAGTEVPVERDFVVGRGETGWGNLRGDPEISRSHARFRELEGGVLLVEDLGSTNGTFVNGQRITGRHVLRSGDRIRMGQTTLVLGGPAATAPTDPGPRPRVAPPPPPPPAATAPPPGAPAAAGAAAPLGAIPGAQTIGGSPAPGAPPSAGGGGGGGSRSALRVVLGLVLLVGVGVAAYFIGKGNNSSSSSAATTPSTTPGVAGATPAGTVYVESNTAKANGNTVIAMQYGAGGNLSPLRVTEYPTGGAGSTDLTDSGVLDADHHLWYDASKKLLFAVNQGSDTIAVFNVAADGSLTPVQGSPFPSGGMAPASVSVVGDTAIVANKAQDGVRNLETVAPTYATFHVGPTGALTQFGPVISALPKSSPTDVDPAPNGTFLLSTEEGGPFRAFTLGPNGLTQGSNSPLAPDASIFPPNFDAAKKWGLGISANPKQPLEYIGMATVNKIAVYQYDATGKLTYVRAVDAPGAELPCWTLVNAAGTRLYTANAGNDSVNVFDLTDPTTPKPLQNLKLHGDGNPWDMRFDPTEKEIFLITPRARMNVKKGDGQTVHTLLIGADGTLTEPDYSPVTLPVAQTYQPYGMAVAPRG